MARAAEASRKLRSAALSKTASPRRRITASWTTAVGESVWSVRSRLIRPAATRRNSSYTRPRSLLLASSSPDRARPKISASSESDSSATRPSAEKG